MRDYGRVYSKFWTSTDIQVLTDDGRILALYLLSGPHGTIAGVCRLPDGYVCEDLRWTAERVSKGFRELFANRFSDRCETTKWVWIRKFLEWNTPENPNQWKAARKIAASVPDNCSWKAAFSHAFASAAGDPLPPTGNPSGTVPKGLPTQDQKQEQDQEQKQKQEGATVSKEAPGGERKGSAPDFDPKAEHEGFELVKAAYPKFAGRQDWINAELACHNRIEQDEQTWETLLASADRYAKHIRAKGSEGSQFVMSPGKFFSAADEPWKQDWPIPVQPSVSRPAQHLMTHDEREARDLGALMARRDELFGETGFRAPLAEETASAYRKAQDEEWETRQARRAELHGAAGRFGKGATA